MNPIDLNKISVYKEVVIDAAYCTKDQVDYLHKKGIKVYSYLDIGSIENFRPYYKDFVGIALGDYENWPEEKWIDVSNAKWQDYVVNVMAKNLSDKGVDGFFLDNLDVYSDYKNDKIFNGILTILNRLNSTYSKLRLISNGGQDFFTEAISKNLDVRKLIYGVNTEFVYTSVDFKNNRFYKNSTEDREDTVDYLKNLKSRGIDIYMLEYTTSSSISKEIRNYYDKLKFKYYIANSLDLK